MADQNTYNGPAEIVSDAYETYKALALNTVSATNSYIRDLGTYPLPQVPVVSLLVPQLGTLGAPFQKPTAPVAPNISYDLGATPAPIQISPIAPLVDTDIPDYNVALPDINIPVAPGPLTILPPTDEPSLTDVIVPTFARPTLPDAPLFVGIELPPAPTLNLPTFSSLVPELIYEPLSTSFSFAEDAAESPFSLSMKDVVSRMTSGGTGLPASVEAALFARARTRELATARNARQQTLEEWSSRGFTLPGGEVAKRLAEVNENERTASNTLQRDVMVQVHQAALEQIRSGVATGVQLEGNLLTFRSSVAERTLRAAQAIVDTEIALTNARLAQYNAKLQGVAIEAQVYEARIRGELAKTEVYRSQIEAQRLRGDINEQLVRLYVARVQGVSALIDAYKAEVDGVKAIVDVDRNRVELHRARVQSYSDLVQAKRAEYDGYSARVQAEVAKAGIYESTSRAFAERVRAYATRVESRSTTQRLQIEAERLKVETYNANVQGYSARAQAEASRIAATTSIFDGKARLYASELGAEEARVQADTRQFELNLEVYRSQTSVALDQLRAQSTIATQTAGLALEAIRGAATTSAQLAAGAMSAVNASAGISGTTSDGTTQGVSITYSVDGGQATPPGVTPLQSGGSGG